MGVANLYWDHDKSFSGYWKEEYRHGITRYDELNKVYSRNLIIERKSLLRNVNTEIESGLFEKQRKKINGNPYFKDKKKRYKSRMEGLKMDWQDADVKTRINTLLYAPVRQVNSSGKYRDVYIRGLLVEVKHSILREKVRIEIVGSVNLDAGYVYAPYIPMGVTSIFEGDRDYKPSEEIKSRYATTIVNPEFYGNINIGDL